MISLRECEAMDATDPLAPMRARFRLPDGVIYLDGNSLGALPAATPARVAEVVERDWGERLIASWNEAGWVDAPRRVGAAIAPLIGAAADEVLVADSTSVNLFKLTVAAAERAPGRPVILAEADNFPTVLHVARRAAALTGRTLRVAASNEVADAIADDVAVVVLAHVNYRSGARHDLPTLQYHAQARGARVVWDLSHSAGAMPLDLAAAGAELAVGCGYKYLNGGPGAPAFLFVARALQDALASPVAGWFGHEQPFAFEDAWRPAAGVARFAAGTPPILGLLALEQGVAAFEGVDLAAVWAKSCRLFDLFSGLVAQRCPGLELLTPAEPDRRGSHLSFRHLHGFRLMQALIARGVVGDFRAPDVMRFGLTPLYTRFADIWRAVDTLAALIADGSWRDPRFAVPATVT